MKSVETHFEKFIDVQVVAAIEVHEVECVVNVSEPLRIVFTHV